MSEELKPCPMCGGEPYLDPEGPLVHCLSCDLCSHCEETEQEAAKIWNTRVQTPLEQELVEALRELTNACDNFGVSGGNIPHAKMLIAKAEGQS